MPQRANGDGAESVDDGMAAPSISLPRGGGAIQGIGEKFAANPVTGTGSLTVPLAVSPGRGGFGPSLELAYDSGSGNGPFGLGWQLSLPRITRKTDRGLPRYAGDPEDVFILSGAEDLVPMPGESRRWVGEREYVVRRYRPRVEGLFARIERWADTTSGDVHWRSISPENVTTLYGLTAESRIVDSDGPSRVFSWLVCESRDGTGNAIVYEYKAEDSAGVAVGRPHEVNRTDRQRSANRYPKRITYGNRVSTLVEPDLTDAEWLFEAVFDYGEHEVESPTPRETSSWPSRPDAFSSHRSGFEVRTYRLCRRVLMFHHFPDEPGVGQDCLVRSTDLEYQENPVGTRLVSVQQHGHRRTTAGYVRRSMPPLEFSYTDAVIDDHVRTMDADSLRNLPIGVDDAGYRWVDLDGEGLSGVLTEQAGEWFYKPNLGAGRLGSVRQVSRRPSVAALNAGRQQLLDLSGDGELDLVDLDGPVPGFYERTPDGDWTTLRPFRSRPVIDWNDPNVRFVDLTGDGHADVMLTAGDELVWYPSLGEDGFGKADRAHPGLDDERGPRLVFADGTESIHLADMTGDGLTDLVRIRNGEVCYWPNQGYGRFGAKVVMDGAPWFDEPDQFDQRRIRTADVDGSGTVDLFYLHRSGTRVYRNLSGNGFAPAEQIQPAFPRVENVSAVATMDLLGNGTACLVWSSPLPSEAGRQVRYVDLMGGRKPHLLTSIVNNLGAETHIEYAPSTRFYLADRAAGRPWVTRLPFPVHVVERVVTLDRVSRNRFVTRYAYHHGHFDGTEREFRGFGLVEQYDTETFAATDLDEGELGPDDRAMNADPAFQVPPVLTKTWFHTGAFVDRDRISRQFESEYWRESAHCTPPDEQLVLADTVLPQVPDGELSVDEIRQAVRALKGSMLRQEVYALDGSAAEARPYTVAENNYTIEVLQRAGDPDGHGVFLVHPRERLTAQYERTLYEVGGRQVADPRVGHEVVLEVDDFGHVLRSVSVGYGRRHGDDDPALTPQDRRAQHRTHVVLAENDYTNPVDEPDAYRTPLACEARQWEVLGLEPAAATPGSTNLFGVDELASKLIAVTVELPYSRFDVDPDELAGAARRLIEHDVTLFRRDDLSGPLPRGELESLALPHQSFRKALTPDLLTEVYSDRVDTEALHVAGYVRREDGAWWVPSGRFFHSPGADDAPRVELTEARAHFFAGRRFVDPFGASTRVDRDPYDLAVVRTEDPLGNRTSAVHDYRVLQPRLATDPNRNRTEVAFDALGMVVGTAVMGKPEERMGDSLIGFDPDPPADRLAAYLADPEAAPQELLGEATTRLVFDLFAYRRTRDSAQPQPVVVATMAREIHVSDLGDGEHSAIQHGFTYSDGFGREIQRKLQSEPAWIGTGWTVFDNKGQPVREYEPFPSSTHEFEFARRVGVSSVLFYDPAGRAVATIHPNATWEKVEFDPWRRITWDVNDTVLLEPREDADIGGYVRPYLDTVTDQRTWYASRIGGGLGDAERSAAEKTEVHAGTPAREWLDSLGRTLLNLAHNRFRQADSIVGSTEQAALVDEFHASRLRLDVEGNEREVFDALGRSVMRYAYDMLGSRIRQASMDAGDRLTLNDVAGNPVAAWNGRRFRFRTEYDALRRPVRSFVSGGDLKAEMLFERTEYGEDQPDPEVSNLRTRIRHRYDSAGITTHEAYDFKGNPLAVTRRLVSEYAETPDWSDPDRQPVLEESTYRTSTEYDALDRPTTMTTPDESAIRPEYDRAGRLTRLSARLRGDERVTGFVDEIGYNARGQRTDVRYGNRVRTTYAYDPDTFRLTGLRSTRGEEALQNLAYTYDPAGNITHLADAAQQEVFFRNRRVDASAEYTYDAIYRLVEATGREHLGLNADTLAAPDRLDEARRGLPHPNDGAAMARYRQRYVYDEVGNLLRMAHRSADPTYGGWTRHYRYVEPSLLEPGHVSNRLTGTTDDPERKPEPFGYDEHGNTTSMPELPSMRWSFADELAATGRQVTDGGSGPETTHYVYDASGSRVRKVTVHRGTRRAERIYLGAFEIYREYDGADEVELERTTLHILDDQQRVALVETRTVGQDDGPAELIRFQHANHLGSSTLELDADARVISHEEYHPFGSTSYQAVRSTTETPKRYRFTGKERDEETGLGYHGARYYAPWLGRWTACDPAGMVDGPCLYAYVRDNPIRGMDPDGLAETDTSNVDVTRLPSSNDLINEYVNKKIDEARRDLGITPGSTPTAAQREALVEKVSELGVPRGGAEFSPSGIWATIRGLFGSATGFKTDIEKWSARELPTQEPGDKYSGISSWRIWRHGKAWWVGPEDAVNPSIVVESNIATSDKVAIGTDKLGHFFAQGFEYYEEYLGSSGTELERMTAAIDYGRSTESGKFGLGTTGVYSYADLEANWSGFHFYKRLHDDPFLTFDIGDYVHKDWNEEVNPNYYSSGVLKMLTDTFIRENRASYDALTRRYIGLFASRPGISDPVGEARTRARRDIERDIQGRSPSRR